MKLKSLLNYLLENVDEAALRGFSLDILKKKMPEFERYIYPEDIGIAIRRLVEDEYKLPYLGQGSSRVVYALSTGKVLKIAKTQAGVAQNEAESEVSRNPSTRYIGAKVYESDPNFYWSVMETAQIYKNGVQLKLDLGIPKLARGYRHGYDIPLAAIDLTKVYDRGYSVEEVIEARFRGDPENKKAIEDLRKFLEDPPKSMLALVDLMYNAPTGQALEPGDIITDHFGKTADGRVVLVDYGFTTGVAEDYYPSSYPSRVDSDSGY
jgi:hypothetical protein